MEKTGLTFDDILLLPGPSSVLPSEVSLKTRLTKGLELNIPLISAAMDTVTEYRTAIAMAQHGGIGIIHKNFSLEEQAEQVRRVKSAEYWIIKEPLTVSPDTPISEIIEVYESKNISSFPVVENGKLVGIVTTRDFLFEEGANGKAKDIMSTDLITLDKAVEMDEARRLMHKHRIEKLPIVDKNGGLQGLVTLTDIQNRQRYPAAMRDKRGRLMVGAAIGPRDFERAKKLVEAEVDVIVLDTAHGHSKMVVNATAKIKKEFDVQLIAGNIGTAEAAKDLIAAGADAIKVGVGPGAICTTRVVSGVGVPQFTAILDCAKVADKKGIPVIADGGIKYSGDITKALAAGASSVMAGSLLAGCDESPGRIVYLNNRKFKQYRGMGSLGAMEKGSGDRYFHLSKPKQGKLVPEGIEGIVPYRGSLAEVVFQLMGGIRSGMGFIGAKNVDALRKKTKWLKITEASLRESHPHDVTITEEAPNYPGI